MGMTVEWWKVALRYLVEGIEQQNPLAIMIKMCETLLDRWELRRIMHSRIKIFFLSSETEVAE